MLHDLAETPSPPARTRSLMGMHGTMFLHLRNFIEERHGERAWNEILDAAGLGPRIYLPIQTYADAELGAIVATAAKKSGLPVALLLEQFGEHVAPHLLEMYRHLLKPGWRTLDVLEHVEKTAHRAVRAEQRGAAPPYLEAARKSAQRIEIHYTSRRRLCFVARGIIRGLAKHFDERVVISEPACMHRGAERCLLIVTT